MIKISPSEQPLPVTSLVENRWYKVIGRETGVIHSYMYVSLTYVTILRDGDAAPLTKMLHDIDTYITNVGLTSPVLVYPCHEPIINIKEAYGQKT